MLGSTFPIHGELYFSQKITLEEYESYEWIEECLHHLNEFSSPKEWINFFFRVKCFLKDKGYKPSLLIEMAQFYREQLENHGIILSEEEFNYLTNLIGEKQVNFILTKHQYSQKYKEQPKVSAGLIIGFVKCLAGGLLCIIPAPVAEGIGVGLIISGINDCLDEAKKQSEINERVNEELGARGAIWGYTF